MAVDAGLGRPFFSNEIDRAGSPRAGTWLALVPGMLATAHTIALLGLAPHPVRVEMQSGRGIASFDVVGLPEATVRESRVRVRAAIGQLGIPLHSHSLVANLAPADLRKVGSCFDLAIAVATLAAVGAIDEGQLEGTLLFGELSLTGALRPVNGVLPRLRGARASGYRRAIVPRDNGAEAAAIAGCEDIEVLVADDLAGVVAHFKGDEPLARATACEEERSAFDELVDLAEVRGQPGARRALEIAAAGSHDLLMIGPPGAGKTMLARRLPTLLPHLSDEQAVEITALHSIAGTLPLRRGLMRTRPFRSPHHSVSDAGMLGGGDPPRPGELSLAHCGVLFLDELPEFKRAVLEGLRQPLEDGVITIARARSVATFPARPLVVAAMNPCPCGFLGDGSERCTCARERIRSYGARVSGPMLDRLDLHVTLPPVTFEALGPSPSSGPREESSREVAARVARVREIQRHRALRGETRVRSNARLGGRDLERVARPDAAGLSFLSQAMAKQGLSARAYHKVLRVARTLADLEGKDAVSGVHVREAIHYRVLDRSFERAA